VISSVLVTGLMLMNYTKGLVSAFTFVILLATLTTLIPYAYSAAAQAWMYFTEPELFERKLFVRDMAIAALAFVYSVWAITGSGEDIIAKGFVLLLAGIPVYVLMKGWQRREALKAAFAREPRGGPAVPRPLGPAGLAHKPTGVDQ
jgi:APA family basic amino acid/polyamine antiporter